MYFNLQVKYNVQFPEQTAVPKEQSDNALFDVLQENVIDNKAYFRNSSAKS